MEARAASPQADSTCSRKEGTNAFLQIGVRCCSSFIASAKKRNVVVFAETRHPNPYLKVTSVPTEGQGQKRTAVGGVHANKKKLINLRAQNSAQQQSNPRVLSRCSH